MTSYYSQEGYSFGGRFKQFFQEGSVLSRLILINLIVFLVISFINLFLWLFQVTDLEGTGISRTVFWLAVPADIPQLLTRPWTIITYMFFHEGFFHLFFNMIILFFGGQIFGEFLGSRRLIATYVLGGLSGAIFYIGAYNVFPVFSGQLPSSLALGASASVLAILIAAATYVPQYTVRLFLLGNLKLKHIALILIVLDLFSIQRGNAGGHIAHLGGAFYGFISSYLFKQSLGLKPKFTGLFGRSRTRPFRKVKRGTDDSSRAETNGRPLSDAAYNLKRMERQKRTDQILDKIAKGGYETLSREEKEFLFNSGNDV